MKRLFFSYSHADETLRDTLEKHLAALKHQGLIDVWHDRCIKAGDEFDGAIAENLEKANIILLLVSSDFIASRYCYSVEMKRAMERHSSGDARVIPVILRACDWHSTPFGKLLAAPKDGRAVRSWPDLDEAFLDVALAIKRALVERSPTAAVSPAPDGSENPSVAPRLQMISQPRSSNLRLRKAFNDADREKFLETAFSFMALFFKNSLSELDDRNSAITGKFRRIDNNRFTAVIYKNGTAVSRCKIVLGGMFGRGITYSSNDQASDNSCNESLSVENDDQNMCLKAMGMSFHIGTPTSGLTAEGAAEYYWSMLIGPIQ